jgi:hypothetical protein
MQLTPLQPQNAQNRPLLSTSLQTASNLRVLPSLVQSLVMDLSEAVEERIKSAFDLSRIGKDVLVKGSFRFFLPLFFFFWFVWLRGLLFRELERCRGRRRSVLTDLGRL